MTDNVKTAQAPFIEVAREIREIAKSVRSDFDNSAVIESEVRALRAAADKLERLNKEAADGPTRCGYCGLTGAGPGVSFNRCPRCGT